MNKAIKNYRLVIGLTGPIASGKGLALKAIRSLFEEDEDIRSVLLSDYIRDAVRSQGQELTRDTLREAGNALRAKAGSGAWAEMMINNLPKVDSGVLLVDSIRNPGEIDALRKTFGKSVIIVATDADVEERIARVLKRGREEDSVEIQEIVRQMKIEMERNPETGFDLQQCKEMADIISTGKESKIERIAEIQSELSRFISEREGKETREGKRVA
ncbi:MAG: AAA family ATPase [Candidatus Uhrbacteria bacterium]|nr:AAA family ATPase [Candidatus Uhrbacteria bacterium]